MALLLNTKFKDKKLAITGMGGWKIYFCGWVTAGKFILLGLGHYTTLCSF